MNENLVRTLNVLKQNTCLFLGVYHLHGEAGNSGCKIKWFASVCLERFRIYRLPAVAMHTFFDVYGWIFQRDGLCKW